MDSSNFVNLKKFPIYKIALADSDLYKAFESLDVPARIPTLNLRGYKISTFGALTEQKVD